MIEIRHYADHKGRDIFDEWLTQLVDSRAQAKIAIRIDRLAAGNFGDTKSLRGGLFELRIDCGPGYRVYYTRITKECVLLLCGGSNRSNRLTFCGRRNTSETTRRGVQENEAESQYIAR